MTGDWYHEVDCDYIDDESRGYGDEVVYLGNKNDLDNDESPESVFYQLSMYDRYNFLD